MDDLYFIFIKMPKALYFCDVYTYQQQQERDMEEGSVNIFCEVPDGK